MPVVILAIILNASNILGFTYADRGKFGSQVLWKLHRMLNIPTKDARRKWSQGIAAQSAMGGIFGGDGLLGGVATKMAGGLVRGGLGKVFG